MASRPSFFDMPVDLSEFGPKRAEERSVPPDMVRRVATESGFPSREAPKPGSPVMDPWRYRTGRDTQFNTKVKGDIKRRYQEIAHELQRPVGEVLELALAALERERGGRC